MFEIQYHPEAVVELNRLRAFDRVRVLDAIEKHLTVAPSAVAGSKKRIDLGGDDFVHQLRVGEYRVFYDVDVNERLVIVRHVRRKGQQTTGEIL